MVPDAIRKDLAPFGEGLGGLAGAGGAGGVDEDVAVHQPRHHALALFVGQALPYVGVDPPDALADLGAVGQGLPALAEGAL